MHLLKRCSVCVLKFIHLVVMLHNLESYLAAFIYFFFLSEMKRGVTFQLSL